MNEENYARELKKQVDKILEKWKTSDPCLHNRLLSKDICLMVVDRLLNNTKEQFDFVNGYDDGEQVESNIYFLNEVKRIIENYFRQEN